MWLSKMGFMQIKSNYTVHGSIVSDLTLILLGITKNSEFEKSNSLFLV